MNSRISKVKSWLLDMSSDISSMNDVFKHNLISEEDISKKDIQKLTKYFSQLLITLDDIIFQVENGGYGRKE